MGATPVEKHHTQFVVVVVVVLPFVMGRAPVWVGGSLMNRGPSGYTTLCWPSLPAPQEREGEEFTQPPALQAAKSASTPELSTLEPVRVSPSHRFYR